ncbi:hypothetical protein BDV40DRAFT_304364 [Aspergillus tamarii]|uniref:Cyanovirin-N domain-containing protein n=1 Tax=Aspergillus tamarii TaxID=41984 RepID=A0A5N6UI61_ASPTM|nr:hypothetical protein BDV40DRAFT_304364 [Aspergillus tamarii]
MYWPLLVFFSLLVAFAASQSNDTIATKRGVPAFPGERKYLLDQCPELEIMGAKAERNQNRPPPQSLAFDCKNPDKKGRIQTGALCLNKCLGWNQRTHHFTAQKNGYGLAEWNGNCWDCRFERKERGDNLFCYCANVPEPKPHRDFAAAVNMGPRTFNLDGVVELGNGGVLRCHGEYGHC